MGMKWLFFHTSKIAKWCHWYVTPITNNYASHTMTDTSKNPTKLVHTWKECTRSCKSSSDMAHFGVLQSFSSISLVKRCRRSLGSTTWCCWSCMAAALLKWNAIICCGLLRGARRRAKWRAALRRRMEAFILMVIWMECTMLRAAYKEWYFCLVYFIMIFVAVLYTGTDYWCFDVEFFLLYKCIGHRRTISAPVVPKVARALISMGGGSSRKEKCENETAIWS